MRFLLFKNLIKIIDLLVDNFNEFYLSIDPKILDK